MRLRTFKEVGKWHGIDAGQTLVLGGGNGLSSIPGKVINGSNYYDAAVAIKSNPVYIDHPKKGLVIFNGSDVKGRTIGILANSGTFGVMIYTFDNSSPNNPTVSAVNGQAKGNVFYYYTFPNDVDENYTFVITTNNSETTGSIIVAYSFS